ncbi:MAG: phosphatase PAP2 family protein [Thioalkalispiraceae bacterium]|jgi:undecaprenyl-diphosphatase
MAYARTSLLLQRAIELELGFCRQINRSLGAPFIQGFFAIISRLGDGIFWYSLIVTLPLIYGIEALSSSAIMIVTGILNLTVYKFLKKITCRERPCTTSEDIRPGAHLLDHYSFPSGHTLHAVAFTVIAVSASPVLGWLLIPFASLVAMSRVVLGLHYPTDVVAGAIIGASFASLAISLL